MGAMLTYEWRRITTVRSTWVLSAIFVLSCVGFAYLAAIVLPSVEISGPDGQAPSPPIISPMSTILNTGTNYVSLVFLLTIAAQSFGHEYRYGLIRLTLTAFPQRWQVFLGKTVMVAVWVTLCYLVSVAACWVVALVAGDKVAAEPAGEVLVATGRSLLFVLGYCLIGFALVAITRNLALGVVIPLVWGAIFEGIIASLLASRLPWLTDVLPFGNGSSFANGDALPRSGLVFAAWVVAFLAAAWVTFDRRDA